MDQAPAAIELSLDRSSGCVALSPLRWSGSTLKWSMARCT